MRISVMAAILIGCLPAPAVLAQSQLPPPWEISVAGQIGIPSGWVKVGENDVPGTRLHFRRDLGVDVSEAIELKAGYRLDGVSALRLSLSSIFLDGSTTLPRDVFFNGTTLQGGSKLETRTNFPDFLRVTGAYERTLFPFGDGGMVYGDAGLTYVLLTFRVHGTLAPTTRGHETKEDFLTQELPVPLLGIRADYPLMDRLFGVFSVAGGYLPRVDSLRSEGGDVKLNQAHADLDLGVAYALAAGLDLEAGYHYGYFFQLEKSREDDNEILLSDNAFRLSLAYRF